MSIKPNAAKESIKHSEEWCRGKILSLFSPILLAIFSCRGKFRFVKSVKNVMIKKIRVDGTAQLNKKKQYIAFSQIYIIYNLQHNSHFQILILGECKINPKRF